MRKLKDALPFDARHVSVNPACTTLLVPAA